MSELTNLVFQVRYPYTAAVIAVVWLGTAALLAISSKLPLEQVVIVNSAATILIAAMGFTTPRR
ncbi:MAG TPA: hypothetical protein VHA37_08420 [Candidatus Saccharimonadales bacterium]|nr:hypothetical protein [Candidatus Saccharimonadales bacterium]